MPDDNDPWAEQRAIEAEARTWSQEFVKLPQSVREARLAQLAQDDAGLYVRAQSGRPAHGLAVEDEVERLQVRHEAQIRFAAEHGHRATPPEFVSLTEFLGEPDEDVRYRVDGLWPTGGRVVLAAPNKSGKTTMVGNLIRSLVDGDSFLNRFAVEEANRVVLIDNEMSPGQIRRWLRDQGIRKTDAVDIASLRGSLSAFNILDPAVRAEWAERIGPADVLIFDCLRPVLDALGLSEDKESGRFLEALDELAKQADIGELLLVHHMGHSNERSRGDSRLEDWPDAKWKLVKDDQDDVFFSAFGRDVDQSESHLSYDYTTRHLSMDGPGRARATATRIEQAVLTWIREHPACSQNNIEANVGGKTDTVRKAIHSLADADWVRIEKEGRSNLHYPSDGGAAEDFSDLI